MSSARKLRAPIWAPIGALLGALVLTGCGFHPLYGDPGGDAPTVTAQMDEIQIGLLPNRDGQVMREALERDLQRDGAPGFYRYHLAVSYGTSVQAVGIQPDSSNSRSRFIGKADWVLTPLALPGLVIAKGSAQAMDAENIIDNQYFATSLDNGVMRHQLSREIASQITTQLAVYFRTHPSAKS